MSIDIGDETSLKRKADNNENFTGGFIINAKDGQEYKVEIDKEFSIGRLTTSDLVVNGTYISRLHCTIKYENNKFIIIDNGSHTGTFLNMVKMKKGIANFEVLGEGDLITFGEHKKMEFIYKFSLTANTVKRPRYDSDEMEDKVILQFKQMIENSYPLLKMLDTELLNLKDENAALRNMAEQQFAKFQDVLKLVQEVSKKKDIELLEKHKMIQELSKTCDSLKTKNLLLEIEHKNQINNVLENNLQCSICNEVIVKIHTTNCNHSFCESCIKQWLSRNQVCPICRTDVLNTVNTLSVDYLVTDLYSLIGDTTEEQRENLAKERNVSEQPNTRGRGRQKRQQPIVVTPVVRNRIGYMPYPTIRSDNIDVVDLTNISAV